jgi:hypothetical protein
VRPPRLPPTWADAIAEALDHTLFTFGALATVASMILWTAGAHALAYILALAVAALGLIRASFTP